MWMFERLQDVLFDPAVQDLPHPTRAELMKKLRAIRCEEDPVRNHQIDELRHILIWLEYSSGLARDQFGPALLLVTLVHDRAANIVDKSDPFKADADVNRHLNG